MIEQAATIFALSSGQDRAGVAIVRVSGPGAGAALAAMATGVTLPRVARRARLIDPSTSEMLDDALVLWFPGPRSFTGEDVVEFHVHGGRSVVAGVLGALGRLPGARLAEPGEFTRRAFEHGKIDLTEAEGLADLIDAETESQRRLALRQLGGELHRAAEAWRTDLLQAQALVEAAIDFADEGDVSERAVADAALLAASVAEKLGVVLADANRGEILRDGFRVVIAGPPNVGKSSLINAIAKRDAAIVSPEAGTTRDIVELQLNLGGIAVNLIDTAGLREAEGNVEREGIRRGLERARTAELILWVVDADAPEAYFPPHAEIGPAPTLWVLNKSDLTTASRIELLGEQIGKGGAWIALSASTGVGIIGLTQRIAALASVRTRGGEASLITTARHRQHIQACALALADFLGGEKSGLEWRAEDLRRASTELGKLVGRVDVEEILGAIFGRFCIGK